VGRERRDEASDEDLVRAIAAGDRLALRELYERHSPWLLIRLHQRCADPTIVHDTIQDTFLAVWKGAGRYDGRGTVAAWVWGIGIRRLIGQFRKAPRATLPLRVGDDGSADGVLVSAEDLVLTQVEHGPLAQAINALSPELRLVVQATVLDGLTTREAATLLGIPTGTVKTRMMRAKREMREALT
jgi:RNA polymerase sigma-70 factor (ECF subfamily)